MKDEILATIASYVCKPASFSDLAYDTARLCVADSMGCAILALNYPACTKLLGPVVPDTNVPGGSHVPGTDYILDPIRAAFNFGTMIRWLDYNDTWLAAEWGHPSDNLGGILMVGDYLCQKDPMAMKKILEALIKAYEIQGVLALSNSFNSIGFDHVILVKIATAAVCTWLLGGTEEKVYNALSNAFADAGPLRLYRHAPNTGSRKSWAAGDATARGVQFAWMSMQGEMGYPHPLTAETWGVNDTLLPITLTRELGSYVMEHILFKIAYPAEFHAQTAVEAAIELHPQLIGRLDQIETILIETQSSAIRIIDKKGALHNPADRDHCLQYMVAVALLKGALTAEDYEDANSKDPRLDLLRSKMEVIEHHDFSHGYLDPLKRSIGNKITVHLSTGEIVGPVSIEYPLGHKKRRQEGTPLLFEKLYNNLQTRLDVHRIEKIMQILHERSSFEKMIVSPFLKLY